MEENWDDDITPSAASSNNSGYYGSQHGNWREQPQKYTNDRTFWNSKSSSQREGGGRRGSRHGDSDFRAGKMYSDRTERNSGQPERNRSNADGYNGRSERFLDRNADHDQEEASEIVIGNSFVGRVIGRGGSKIQELQNHSGAYIKILKDENGTGETSIRLVGTSEAQEKAKTMIEELISEFSNISTSRNTRSYDKPDYSSNKSDYSYKKSHDQSNYSGGGSSGFYSNRNDSTNASSYDYNQTNEAPLIDWDNIHKVSEEQRLKKLASLPPIIKDFYKEDPEVAAMTPREVGKFRAENNSISVMKVDTDDDREVPNPVTSFKHAFQPYPELLQELQKQGFTSPSPIQSQAWPIIMKGNDMIGIAQTGTGKTIAFLFPALIHLVGQVTPREQRRGPSVLILAPTRELAQQIEAEAKKYRYRGIKSICIYGGGNRREQINLCTQGVDIVIATPGRLNDLTMNGAVDVSGVTYLVLDEADRMLDLGFEPQIRKIVLDIRDDRQTIMTSATWTNEIQDLANRYMIQPFKVNVGAFDLAAVHTVTQEIVFGEDDYDERKQFLDEFIENMGPDDKAIVFVEKKAIADDISSDLILKGVNVQSIHGDREQCDREQALDDLKTGYVKVLIATDVASRGIDIKDVTLILNLYFPRNIEEYVHRVGRTGRAGRTGKAISLVTRKDWMHAESLIKILEEADQFVPEELREMADRYRAWKRKKMAEDEAAGGRGRRRGGGAFRNRF